jgi:hypothetical protein
MTDDQLPIVERIARNLLTAVAGITTNAGYSFDARAERSVVIPSAPTHGLVQLFQLDPAVDGDPAWPRATHLGWLQTFVFAVYLQISESATIPLEQVLNLAKCDVERAVMADPRRGGLCSKDTTILAGAVDGDQIEAGIVCLFVPVQVPYVVSKRDPRKKL